MSKPFDNLKYNSSKRNVVPVYYFATTYNLSKLAVEYKALVRQYVVVAG